jgi:hypothetical protein
MCFLVSLIFGRYDMGYGRVENNDTVPPGFVDFIRL